MEFNHVSLEFLVTLGAIVFAAGAHAAGLRAISKQLEKVNGRLGRAEEAIASHDRALAAAKLQDPRR